MRNHHDFTESEYLSVFRHESISKVPNFCQPIDPLFLDKLRNFPDFPFHSLQKNPISTNLGDFTVYKALGFSSTWVYAPPIRYRANAVLDSFLTQKSSALKLSSYNKTPLQTGILGGIYATNQITNWFVKAGIESEAQLRFLLDNISIDLPEPKQIEHYIQGRQQIIDHNIIPIVAENLIVEPANLSLPWGLTAKLMRKNPELLSEFYTFLANRTESAFRAALKAGMRIFCVEDESGYNTGPMYSPSQYKHFIAPFAKKICDLIHDHRGVVIMFTDGFVEALIPYFIEAGFDALQPLEPNSRMSIRRVRELWGNRLTLIGNIDTSSILSFGTKKDVQTAVQNCFREAKGDSDHISEYIFAASGAFHGKVKVENVRYMMEEYEKLANV